jgi:hypothetical protein
MQCIRSPLLALGFFVLPCSAQDSTSAQIPAPVQALLSCSSAIEAARIELEMASRLAELGRASDLGKETLRTAGHCLDERLAEAVEAAQASPNLVSALKEYFTAAQSYRSSLLDVSGGQAAFIARAKRAAEPHTTAVQRVRMEAMLSSP